jgi:CheY-like chemotaxis protein
MSNQKGKPVFSGEVLLCDDNKMNQDIFCGLLAKTGLTVTVADNGKEGVEIATLRAQNGIKPFDLIFMDIHMPVMGGLEAAAQITSLNTGTIIVASSANNIPEEQEQYAANGMSGFLHKPFTVKELNDCLERYLTPVSYRDTDIQSAKKFKVKLVQSFLHNNASVYHEITQALDGSDIKRAHRLAHSLKGNAGMLEKTPLQQTAAEIENRLADGENRVQQPLLDILKNELDTVIRECELFLAQADTSTPEDAAPANSAALPDGETICALFTELEELLDGGSLECLGLIDRLRPICESGEPLVRELIQQIEYFEFDAALKTLARLREG